MSKGWQCRHTDRDSETFVYAANARGAACFGDRAEAGAPPREDAGKGAAAACVRVCVCVAAGGRQGAAARVSELV